MGKVGEDPPAWPNSRRGKGGNKGKKNHHNLSSLSFSLFFLSTPKIPNGMERGSARRVGKGGNKWKNWRQKAHIKDSRHASASDESSKMLEAKKKKDNRRRGGK